MLHVPAEKQMGYTPGEVSTPPKNTTLSWRFATQPAMPCQLWRDVPTLRNILMLCRRILVTSQRKGSLPFSNGATRGQTMPDRRQNGFTLIELMVIIAVLGVIAAIALPSFQSTIDRRNLVAAANDIFAGLQYARSEAIKRNQEIEFHFDAGTWCYGIADTGNCNCAASPPENCTVDGQQKVVTGDNFRNVDLSVVGFDNATNFEFEPRRGFPSENGSFVLTVGSQSRTVELNSLGRARVLVE